MASAVVELAEVERGCGVGDGIEVGAGGERELFRVASGQGGDEVVFEVVDLLGRERDAGGVGALADAGGIPCGGV